MLAITKQLRNRPRMFTRHGMNTKGNMQLFGWVLAAGSTLITVGILVYVIAILKDSINSTEADTVYTNTLTMFTNFTGQLAPVGTLAGVFLIFGLLALAGIGIYAGVNYGRNRGMF